MPPDKDSSAVSLHTRSAQQQAASSTPILDANLSLMKRQMFSIDSTASPVPATVSALLRANIFTWFNFVFISDLDIFSNLTIRPGREDIPLSKDNAMQLLHLKTIIDTNIFLDDVDHLDPGLYTQAAYVVFSVQRKASLKTHLDASPVGTAPGITP